MIRGDRPAEKEAGETGITPEMIEAGVEALRREMGRGTERSSAPEFDSEVVLAIFQAMRRARP